MQNLNFSNECYIRVSTTMIQLTLSYLFLSAIVFVIGATQNHTGCTSETVSIRPVTAIGKDNRFYIIRPQNKSIETYGRIIIKNCINVGTTCNENESFECQEDVIQKSLLSGDFVSPPQMRDFEFPNGCICKEKESSE